MLLVGGIFLTVKGRFFQFGGLIKSFSLVKKAVFSKDKSQNGVSSFQAACTSLSATVGTGNIVGVAGAVSLGGAGAVFWMWVSAVLGMAVKYGEIALAIRYRDQENLKGGPMYYIKTAMPKGIKKLSVLFCLAALPAVICGGNMTQSNAAITSVTNNYNLKLFLGVVFAVFTWVSLKGGIKRIGNITEKLVPMMSLVYIMLSFCVIFFNIKDLPNIFSMIFKGAFSPKAVTGGAVGSVMRAAVIGASRGVFSNESGLGTSGMSHSVAYDANYKTQGYFGIFEVFIDTIVICTLTALTILSSGVKISYGEDLSSVLVIDALSTVFGGFSRSLIAFMMCIFAFSSVIGWAVYGKICVSFIKSDFLMKLFVITYPLFCILGAVCDTAVIWRMASFFNGIMLIVNLPSVIFLSDKFLKSENKKDDRKKIKGFKRRDKRKSGGDRAQ